MNKLLKIGAGVACATVLATQARAQLPDIATGNISVETILVTSAVSSPVDLVAAHDGIDRLFIVEQSGQVKILQNGRINATPFLDIRNQIAGGGEKGLLGLAFHPGFNNPASPGYRRFYTYTTEGPNGVFDFSVPMAGSPDSRCVIAEWQVSPSDPNVADLSSRRDVLRFTHPQSNHNGGKIAFRPADGYLYIASGDGGNGGDMGDGHTANIGNAQDTTNLLGKIVRIDPLAPAQNPGSSDPPSANGRYRVPASNPFVNGGGLGEIYAYGLRNPYRFSFDAPTNRLIVGDVGQGAIEEVDIVQNGGNYGWRVKEGSFLYNNGNPIPDTNPDASLINPVLEYDHGDGVSVIGGILYRGSAIPALSGRYVFGDYSGRLFQGDLAAGQIEELRLGVNPRVFGTNVIGFGADDTGEVYVLSSGGNPGIYKLVPIPATTELLNLSTRAHVDSDNTGFVIAGFIVTGSAPKTVVVRALGPSLSVNGQPLPGRLANPTLTLYDGHNAPIETNDDWMTGPRAGELTGFNLAPNDPQESAIVATLAPGAYTAVMQGVGSTTGIGLVEFYDVSRGSPANAVNISTRGRVQSGDNVMIAGLIVGGASSQRVLVRALGPSLTGRGVDGALPNPTLELVDANGARIRYNDDWRSDQEAEITAAKLAPANDVESALIQTLAPGKYTAIARSADSSIGVALVEIYRLSP
ncbi:MAG: PQQ-dependent sugar dehydrogenase [Chthoniobacterales bacterium]